MNEITKTRLHLVGGLLIVCAFVFLIIKIFSGCDGSSPETGKTVESAEEVQEIVYEQPAAKIQPVKPVESFVFPDDSKAFRGIMKSWRCYRLPKCGILVDVDANRVLWSYNADKVVPIASMSKMLTLYMALQSIKNSNGVLSLDNKVLISKGSATGKEGGFGFMPGQVYSVRDLMKAATIRSANDAASALAVYFGDSEENFIRLMNIEAQKLGMKNSYFINPHGLPVGSKDNVSTMNDMMILSLKMLKEPDFMSWAKMRGARIGSKTIVNTNNLMRKRRCPGVDGLKTGYTRRAGFCLAFSCIRNNRRLVGVVAGFPSAADRENFLTALLQWGYKQK